LLPDGPDSFLDATVSTQCHKIFNQKLYLQSIKKSRHVQPDKKTRLPMITTKDFDEIVLDNPFLTGDIVGYGVYNLPWEYLINYSPDSLTFFGQSNSTCKYIILKNTLTDLEYKIVREDDHITITDLNDENRQSVTDPNQLAKVEQGFDELKELVRKQIGNYYATIKSIESNKFNFHLDDTRNFIKLLYPSISDAQQEKIIKRLKRVEKNPAKYFEDPTDTIDMDAGNIIQSLFLNVLTEQLEKVGSLIIVDWRSPHDEVMDLLIPLFQQLQISPDERMNRADGYETSSFLNDMVTILSEHNYQTFILGEISDTYLLVYVKSDNIQELKALANKINLTIRQWEG
jgi:hypothetical protein